MTSLTQVQLRCDVVVGDRAGGLAADADRDLRRSRSPWLPPTQLQVRRPCSRKGPVSDNVLGVRPAACRAGRPGSSPRGRCRRCRRRSGSKSVGDRIAAVVVVTTLRRCSFGAMSSLVIVQVASPPTPTVILSLSRAGALLPPTQTQSEAAVAGGAACLRQRPGVGQQRAVGVDRGRAREVVGAGAVGVQGPGRGERTAAVVVGDLLAQVQLRCDVVVGDRAGGLAADADGDLVLVGAGALAAADADPVRGRVAGGPPAQTASRCRPAACRRCRPGSSPRGRWRRCRWRSGSRRWRAAPPPLLLVTCLAQVQRRCDVVVGDRAGGPRRRC